MNARCRTFRTALEQSLADTRANVRWRELGWHEHVLTCPDCRDLLASEEALDAVLASLPEPRLPRRLTERLLVRLRASRVAEDELDRLLALDEALPSDADVAMRVLTGLEPEREAMMKRREAALDALLEREAVVAPEGLSTRILACMQGERLVDVAHAGASEVRASARAERVLAPTLDQALESAAVTVVPSGLAARTLDFLATHRGVVAGVGRTSLRSRAPRGRLVVLTRSRWLWAAAAGVLVTLAAWLVWARPLRTSETAPIANDPRPRREVRPGSMQSNRTPSPDTQLLSALEVLEQWELLMRDDVDVLLSTLAPADEALLDVESAALPPEEAPGETEAEPDRRKG